MSATIATETGACWHAGGLSRFAWISCWACPVPVAVPAAALNLRSGFAPAATAFFPPGARRLANAAVVARFGSRPWPVFRCVFGFVRGFCDVSPPAGVRTGSAPVPYWRILAGGHVPMAKPSGNGAEATVSRVLVPHHRRCLAARVRCFHLPVGTRVAFRRPEVSRSVPVCARRANGLESRRPHFRLLLDRISQSQRTNTRKLFFDPGPGGTAKA